MDAPNRTAVSEMVSGTDANNPGNADDEIHKRDFDTFQVFNRKRNAHACIMSIVFIVLYPLGAISLHLPIEGIPFLMNTYLVRKVVAIHAPIQIIASLMMVGGMALGVRIAHDLDYLRNPVAAHVVIGILTVSIIILFQPLMGFLQHRHFSKTGGKSSFAYIHRWIGRGAIALGMINSGLGFQLAARTGIVVPTSSYVRSYVILGVLVSIWLSVVVLDKLKGQHRQRTGTVEAEKGAQNKTRPLGA